MKRLLAFVLSLAVLLSLAACGGGKTVGGQIPTAEQPADALSALRDQMKPPVIAVADFGVPELSESYDIQDYLLAEYPKWMARNDFIGTIPEERTILTCGYEDWGYLVCIVPQDPNASVRVGITRYTDDPPYEHPEELYHSESGDPILLLVDLSDNVTVFVEVIDSEGRGVSWIPYWGNTTPIPEDTHNGALVMDFTPLSEKTPYENALQYGWLIPEASDLADFCWVSDYGYQLELSYHPGQFYDGEACIRENGEDDYTYTGYWTCQNGMLHLKMEHCRNSAPVIDDSFPVLVAPENAGWLQIFRNEDGLGLPQFADYMESDELYVPDDTFEDPYAYALTQGWRLPEFDELMETFWLTDRYGLELMEDTYTNDNGGDARIYDVHENGTYTLRYTGSWYFDQGMLRLLMESASDDGTYVDDSFPVLMLDSQLWMGRNENGAGLPHFEENQILEIFQQAMG